MLLFPREKKTYFTFGKSPPAASRLENLTKTLPTVKNTIRGLMESFVWTSRFQGGRWSGEGVSVSEQVTQGVTHGWRTWETCDVKLRTTRKTMYEKVIKCIQMYYNRWHWGWPTVDGHGKHGMRTTRKTLRTTFYLIITSRRQWEWVWWMKVQKGKRSGVWQFHCFLCIRIPLKTQSSNQRNALSACKGEPGTTQTCVGERNGWGDSGGDGDRGGGAPVGSLADRQPVNNLWHALAQTQERLFRQQMLWTFLISYHLELFNTCTWRRYNIVSQHIHM